MANKNDGGAAFPTPSLQQTAACSLDNEMFYEEQGQMGLSVRDYFAGQALIGLLGNEGITREMNKEAKETPDTVHHSYARMCYGLADAMLAEREKQ